MTVRKKIAEALPTVDWSSLPLLLDEKKAALILGVSLSYLRKSRSEGTRFERTPASRCSRRRSGARRKRR
jgi:hypothetical protein